MCEIDFLPTICHKYMYVYYRMYCIIMFSYDKSLGEEQLLPFEGAAMISIVYGSPATGSPNNWAAIVG
jgi:hypothetical protein